MPHGNSELVEEALQVRPIDLATRVRESISS